MRLAVVWFMITLLGVLISFSLVRAEDGGENEQDAGQASNNYWQKNDDHAEDDYIKYWTEYAILPKRCIVYNDVDVVVFSVFEHGYKQCSDEPTGTFIAPVHSFLAGYLEQVEMNEQDKGNDDYVVPDSAQYLECTRTVVQNNEYWVQIGCTDGTSQSLSVNIFSDNTCETRDQVNGYDDSSIDVSEMQLPFKQCQPCVNWMDKNDDEIDDMFYENRQTEAPMCSNAWSYREKCNRKCQKTGLEPRHKDGWNTSDKVLLTILSFFGAGMLVAILDKRRNMSNKDALLEQAAMSAAGLQQIHVIGIFVLVIVVITVFALLGLKNITWALLLMMNTALFGYLMKLTVDSGVSTGETVIGPDGTVIRRGNTDDSSCESSRASGKGGGYNLPSLA